MTTLLDAKRIRTSTHAQLREYYLELFHEGFKEDVTDQLLQAIERGSVPPHTFALWLRISKSPHAIYKALLQNKSIHVRQSAIKQLQANLRMSTWRKTWDGIGGTAGVLEIFADLSVLEVRQACRVIGRSAKGADLAAKRECFTDLLKGLHPGYFPEFIHKTTDQRPLAKYYGLLAPACSQELIEQAILDSSNEILKHTRQRDLLQYHSTSLGQEQLRRLTSDYEGAVDEKQLENLCRNYPASSSKERGFSASMQFALTFLRGLIQQSGSDVDDSFFIKDLVQPLLHRAVRKRTDWDRIYEILDLTLQYLELHPSAGRLVTIDVGDILYLVAYCWARKPTLFEAQLRTLISHPFYGTSHLSELNSWDSFLTRILPSRRYDLLRFGVQASTQLDIDVDTDLANVKGYLTQNLLFKLRPGDALSLFSRLRKIRGDENLVDQGNPRSILFLTPTYEAHNGDPEMFHIQLHKLNGYSEEAEALATRYIERRKKQATSASQPEQRGFYGKSALFSAIASGSLDLYRNTVEWSKRFIRDPLVLKEIYPRSYPEEVISLLSGIAEPHNASLTMSDLYDRVEKANSILTSIFETACDAILEPSFAPQDWEGVLRLFFEVVAKRIDLIANLRTAMKPSEEELHCSIWGPTLTLIIAIEEKANQDDYGRLQATSIRGILDSCYDSADVNLKTHDTSVLRFFDELAKARNTLWSAIRASKCPTMDTIPEALPRGLPIQHLTGPWVLDVEDLETYAPYLYSRMMDALFPKTPGILQTVSKEILKPMGVFVNSYQFAMQLHIPPSCVQTVKQERIQKVWRYVTGPLSQNRMNKEEAERFWRGRKPKYLLEWPPIKSRDAVNIDSPLYSKDSNSGKRELWNPFPVAQPKKKPRSLGKPTFIDLSLAVTQHTRYNRKLGDIMVLRNEEIPLHDLSSCISWEEVQQSSENQAIAAMLYLNTWFGFKDDDVFTGPFPSENDVRYPALLLHQDSQKLETMTAIWKIHGAIDVIPSELLNQVTRNITTALDAADLDRSLCPANAYAKLHEIVMRLVVELGECDRPSLAKEFLVQTILDRPDSSSWHRQLLKPSFLRRLSASDAQTCFKTFATRLIGNIQTRKENLETAKRRRDEGVEESLVQNQLPDVPHVKVTTMKYFAELLRGTDFIGENHAIQILNALAQTALHIDVRLSIVSSLLAILKTTSVADQDEVLNSLELLATSAGNWNEREPITESNWEQAEAEFSLPETNYNPCEPLEARSPILHAILTHYCNEASDADSLQPYVERIILPTIARLTQQTSRWVSLFLSKHGIEKLDTPLIPRQTNIIPTLLSAKDSKLKLLPRMLLEDFTTHVVFNITPPLAIKALNEKLQTDPALRSQPDVQTWLQLYGQGLSALDRYTLFDILSLFEQVTESASTEAITPKVVQENFFKIFSIVLANDTPSYQTLSTTLTDRLVVGDYLAEPWWVAHGKTMINAMIAHVASLHTREWERDPKRNPDVLPDTFNWRLLLIDYPWPQSSDNEDDRERKCKAFSDQLATILKDMSGSLYHQKLALLQIALARDVQSSALPYSMRSQLQDSLNNNRVLTAIHLGDVTKTMLSWLTTPDLLRVEVAKSLVETVWSLDGINPGIKQRLCALLESWKICENEEVRRIGYSMEAKYFSTK